MNRRDFLRGAAGLAASSVVGPAGTAQAPLLPPSFYDLSTAMRSADILRAARMLDAHNVPRLGGDTPILQTALSGATLGDG